MIDAGLILEGGGMRGLYTIGVLDLLLDEGLLFSHIYGVSAGACHAMSYISGQRGRAMKTVTEYIHDRRYASVYSLLTTGDFFGGKFNYRDVPERLLPLDFDAYETRGVSMRVVVTNCRTGEAEYIPLPDARKGMIYVQASSSLPLLSKKVKIGEEQYLDGGIADSIPLARSLSDGHAKNLVVLTQHPGYRKEKNSMLPLIKLRYFRYPELIKSIETRHMRYNESLDLVAREAENGTALVLRPSVPVTVGRLEKDFGKLRALYESGYHDASNRLAEIRRFFAPESA